MAFDFNEFINSSMRIFNVSRKPSMQDFRMIAQITGLGIILIGLIGFVVKLFLDGVLRL